ncbi:cyclic AMP-dependent transcription factor ATF-6 alpha [Eurosta solidaginis]|uniref:cyclic AMP-dependent transcription factor ATF-6 alpha n=1 Tax=Eurosta solidaginis TaxID=178769 RepID=UPI003530EA85
MDLESVDGESFYGNLDSFMTPQDNYALDDIEEILRSTDSHLDSSIDLNTFTPHNVGDFDIPLGVGIPGPSREDILTSDEFDMSSGSNKVTTFESHESKRTSSISSMDEDSFNPDDFLNFLPKDAIQMDCNIENELRERNTPSPTESCSSSGGSSTSGVQSDISSVASRSQTHVEVSSYTDPENSSSDISPFGKIVAPLPHIQAEQFFKTSSALAPPSEQQTFILPAADTNNVGVSLPALKGTLHSLCPPQQVQTISVLPTAFIPVKSFMSLQAITQATGSIKSTAHFKVEPKLAPKTSFTKPTNVTKSVGSPTTNVTKIIPPSNTKPKTVFLTMNDYKALTQMNNKNGKCGNSTAPKIILKTASGKLITANKVASSGNNALSIHQNFVPKILKTNNGTVVIKQQVSKSAQSGNNIAVSSKSGLGAGPTSLSVYKGLIDEKMWKKQQRMIKNRESASLSRKKKKDYVVSLESRISDLEKENCTLKGENSSLRSQLVAFAQSCQCQNGNISEFVLNALDINTKISGRDQHGRCDSKSSSKSLKQRISAANVKKNIAILFAIAFMVSMNVGNFQNYMNKNTIENSIESANSADEPVGSGRRLLWAENEFKKKLSNSKREGEIDVPPLHFLHPINRSRTTLTNEHSPNITVNDQLTSTASKCGSGSNYTENYRLHSNLQKWIDVNDYLNLSLYKKHGNALDNSLRFGKFASDYYDRKPLQLPIQDAVPSIKMKRKMFITPTIVQKKQPKTDTAHENGIDKNYESGKGNNYLDIYKPKISDEYLRLFKGIKRQDDTFYVLSFNIEHILLPASAYNKSARPKMSLMLPAGDPSVNGDITLMQIDCEVVNTTELELKSFMIPEKLRPHKFGNTTPSPNDMVNNETLVHEEQRKAKGSMPEMPKQKSPPKTYYMMGPRSAAEAAAMKKKPIIVPLEGNEFIEHLTANIGKNSTITSNAYNTQ